MQLAEDCKGWLLTCDRNRQKQALKDAYNFLTQYIEQVYDDLVSEAIQNKLRQQNKQLSLEAQLKQTKKVQNRLLFSIDTKVQCTIFVKINQKFSNKIDPVLIVDKMMQDVYIRKKDITRYCHKILPVQRSFRAEHFKMLDVVDELFNQKSQPGEVKSWALNFKCRNNSKFNYKQILKQVQKIANKYGHFADIYYPQWMVSIQITNHLMCIAISQKFKQYNQYKFHKKIPLQPKQKRQNYQQKQQDKQQQKIKKQNQNINKNNQINKEKLSQEELSKIKLDEQQKQKKQKQIREKLQTQIIKPSQQQDFDLF